MMPLAVQPAGYSVVNAVRPTHRSCSALESLYSQTRSILRPTRPLYGHAGGGAINRTPNRSRTAQTERLYGTQVREWVTGESAFPGLRRSESLSGTSYSRATEGKGKTEGGGVGGSYLSRSGSKKIPPHSIRTKEEAGCQVRA